MASLDSQSVKTTEVGGIVGFDAGKKVKGRKRHILVDTLASAMVGHGADDTSIVINFARDLGGAGDSTVIGGQLGARYGRRLDPGVLRALIVIVGATAIVKLLLD